MEDPTVGNSYLVGTFTIGFSFLWVVPTFWSELGFSIVHFFTAQRLKPKFCWAVPVDSAGGTARCDSSSATAFAEVASSRNRDFRRHAWHQANCWCNHQNSESMGVFSEWEFHGWMRFWWDFTHQQWGFTIFLMGVYWDLTSKHEQCQNGDVWQFSVSKIGIWMYLHLTGRINQVCLHAGQLCFDSQIRPFEMWVEDFSAPKSVAFPVWIVSSYPKLHESFNNKTQGFNQGRWRLGPWVRGTSSWPTREYLWKIIWFHSMGRMLHRKLQQNTSIDHFFPMISTWYPPDIPFYHIFFGETMTKTGYQPLPGWSYGRLNVLLELSRRWSLCPKQWRLQGKPCLFPTKHGGFL